MIRIAIAEDISRIAQSLREKLELSDEFHVKLIANNGSELIRALGKDHNFDVILMDIQMPEMDGIEATEKVSVRWPHIKVVMSTVFDDENHIFDAILAGASGYLMKDEPPRKLHEAIHEVLDGGAPMSAGIARKALRMLRGAALEGPASSRPSDQTPTESFGITPRETEILEHLSTGLSYDQIAGNLFISSGTVRKHIENIYRKLQVSNKVEAVQKATKNRLI